MKLIKAQVTEFKSIRDSGEFTVGDITCLVGKNESGKTALLQAIYRLNPFIPGDATYDVTGDYPRIDVEDYRMAVESGDQDPADVVSLLFEMDDDDAAAVTNIVGPKALGNRNLRLSKGYKNAMTYSIDLNEKEAVQHLVRSKELTPDASQSLSQCETVAALLEALKPLEKTQHVTDLKQTATEVVQHGGLQEYVKEIIQPQIPKLLYFDEYYEMEGHAKIEDLKARKEQGQLRNSDYPLLGLINLARLDLDQLLSTSRTRQLKNALEGAGNHLTKKVIDYWSQNRHLSLRFDVRPGQPGDPEGMRDGTNIWGEVYDSQHQVTTEFGTRSRGFVWFFSFLAWYGDIERNKENVILLLDEPGLSLHAKAQEDLLRYFDAELDHQMIYTTHSPFMVDPRGFDRIRIVQDLSIDCDDPLPREEAGTKVLEDVLDATADSLFPLQGALGYEIHQTLFVGPSNLVIEGVSDLLYISTMTDVLESLGRTGLDSSWTITPVGGSDKVPTFVSLIGAQKGLNIAVLVDYQKRDKQTLERLFRRKLLQKRKVLTYADFLTASEADVEDLFEESFYLDLVNGAYASGLQTPIKSADLNGNIPRVAIRLEEYFKKNPLKDDAVWNHYRPARYLVDNLKSLGSKMPAATLDFFEDIFKRLNTLL